MKSYLKGSQVPRPTVEEPDYLKGGPDMIFVQTFDLTQIPAVPPNIRKEDDLLIFLRSQIDFLADQKYGWKVSGNQTASAGYHQFGENVVRFPNPFSALSIKVGNLYIAKYIFGTCQFSLTRIYSPNLSRVDGTSD